MKAFVCDACGKTITDPHRMKMKEFYVCVVYDNYTAFPMNGSGKVKIDLCDACYHALGQLAKNKLEARS